MHILLTGGGTAGHVIPNIAIADALRSVSKLRLSYLGSTHGLERELCKRAQIPFEAIQTGKLRRYWDLRNFMDCFRIPIGVIQAFFKLLRLRPNVVFSKGGFVGFPVVFAAWLLKIPVFIHESDALPGLATRLSAPFARKIFLGYPEAAESLAPYQKKIEVVGNPVRLSLYEGNLERAKQWTGFDGRRPVLLVMGGSSGSSELNALVKREKGKLAAQYDVLHLTGEGKGKIVRQKHYWTMPFVGKELADVYALASLALCRAGANTLAELEALQIPALLYPLGRFASRGDQVANAQALVRSNGLYRIFEKDKSLLSQLLLLPSRPEKRKETASTQKIAFTLLSNLENI